MTERLTTYQLLTVKRLFESYHIDLTDEELSLTLKTPDSFYHRLVRCPLKNILNGIILEQARDYQIYLQKLFVDYLEASDAALPEEAAVGLSIREVLEELRLDLVKINERFYIADLDHLRLIGQSQQALYKEASDWRAELNTHAKTVAERQGAALTLEQIHTLFHTLLLDLPLDYGLISPEKWSAITDKYQLVIADEDKAMISEQLAILVQWGKDNEQIVANYYDQIIEMGMRLREFRTGFYELILKVTDGLYQLAMPRIDEAKIKRHQEHLLFDVNLGE